MKRMMATESIKDKFKKKSRVFGEKEASMAGWPGGELRSRLSEGKGAYLDGRKERGGGVLVIIRKWSSSGKARKKWCRVDRSLACCANCSAAARFLYP